MRIAIAYPPLPSDKGIPLLSQNRQFQWFHRPTYIYPVVPAYAASLLKEAGHPVSWLDGIAENWTPERFFEEVADQSPDLMLIEAKTPVIRAYWKTIDTLKQRFPALRIALCGDHVTALPRESLERSRVDYILTGTIFFCATWRRISRTAQARCRPAFIIVTAPRCAIAGSSRPDTT